MCPQNSKFLRLPGAKIRIKIKTMENHTFKILLIEDSPEYTAHLAETLGEAKDFSFELECFKHPETALEHLRKKTSDVVLLSFSLVENRGPEMLEKIRAQAPDIPVIVLTDSDSNTYAMEAVQKGAQDYLAKDGLDGRHIMRAIRFAMIRHHTLAEFRALAIVDELTGIHNRRGFINLGEQQLKLARRTKKEIVLIFLDLDGLKSINDRLGHQEGDVALIETAKILKQSFRNSDIVARIGGDEFAVIAIEAGKDHTGVLIARLRQKLKDWNAEEAHRFRLSFSVGIACLSPGEKFSLEELMAQADEALYREKRAKAHVQSEIV